MIFLFGAGIALFLLLLLVGKKNKNLADVILILWMLFFALDLFLFYYDKSGAIFEYFPLIHGPFLFVYVRYLTGVSKENMSRVFFHFVPALLSYLFHIPFSIAALQGLLPLYKYLVVTESDTYYLIVNFIVLTSGSVYILLASRHVYSYKRKIKDTYSYLEKVNLNWVVFLIAGTVLILFVALVPYDDAWFSNQDSLAMGRDIFEVITGVLVVIFVILAGYFGINQTNIFTNVKIDGNSAGRKEKYVSSSLNFDLAAAIEGKLLNELELKKHYLDSELTLAGLAFVLQVNSTYLSQVINERLKTNFCDLINRYRVLEFQSRADEIVARKENILTLAFDCGFNSKSQFNGVFKKQTGMTPREYVRSVTPGFAVSS